MDSQRLLAHPDIAVDASIKTVEENADEIMEQLQERLNGSKCRYYVKL